MSRLINEFQTAVKSGELTVIEGVQALKHAVRFGAEIERIVTCDITELKELTAMLAPDISSVISDLILQVDTETFAHISPKNHRTKVASLAKKKQYSLSKLEPNKPVVFLENPKDLENIGAVIRVAAAADAAAVITDAEVNVWHPGVIRGAAGLQYALPVLNVKLNDLISSAPERQLISLDPEGEVMQSGNIPKNAILIFGTERRGITKETLRKSNAIVRLPMKKGVSSLNLATSVAATLYSL